MKYCIVAVLFALTSLSAQQSIQPITLDTCEDTSAWKTFQSAGVAVTQQIDAGVTGNAVRFDVSFLKGSGYGGVFRNFNVPLPENFEISFLLRATVPVNNFEVKVSNDSSGETIWWVNNKNYTYPSQWKRITVKKRHLSFAWGPHAAPSPDVLRRLELVVTAGSGGKGSVWIDDLRLMPIPQLPAILPDPTVTASSTRSSQYKPENILPGKGGSWQSKTNGNEWLETDLKFPRDFGAIELRWDPSLKELDYNLLGSLDGKKYDTLYTVQKGKSGSVLLYTPESEARYLRLSLVKNLSNQRFIVDEMRIVPSESLSTANHFFEHLAASSPKGNYPRYFLHQGSFWTVVGVPSDYPEALLNEDGTFEVDKQHFSLEPFIRLEKNGELLHWANGSNEQWLENGYMPIPTVRRKYPALSLSVTLLASGEPSRSALMARYIVKNTSSEKQRGMFFIALRPFQVNPTYQWLNFEGGWANTGAIRIDGNRAATNDKTVIVSGVPASYGAATIDDGEIVEHISSGKLPGKKSVDDARGMASAAFQYTFNLNPGDSMAVVAAIPFTQESDWWKDRTPTVDEFNAKLAEVRAQWERILAAPRFSVPPDAQKYIDVMKSNIGYILINKDGPGFQPGSRSYERSWIRDGSLTSDALLKMGLRDDVRKFLEWYSSYQYENGMVPCVVDRRGPDPVPEHDSNGELIFACMEYFRFTSDTSFLRERWKNIAGAVKHLQSLRAQRMTSEYRDDTTGKHAYYGLVTESISHEGYSDKARHSYWDNFFVLRGFDDAAAAATALGKQKEAHEYDSIARAFRNDLYKSIELVMKIHHIDYIPGCAELGDFDATSTSIALFPTGESHGPLRPKLQQTFDKYYRWFLQRASGETPWEGYTPYEIRNAGSFVYLGQKDRAHTSLEWFMRYQRPAGWNQWAEVVWKDERRAKFIGDMPHTWVGSDYINVIRALFVYEDDFEHSLIVGGGLKDGWVREGLSVDNLATRYGDLSYSVQAADSSTVTIRLSGTVNAAVTPVKIPVSLLSKPLHSADINGTPASPVNEYVTVFHLPAVVELKY